LWKTLHDYILCKLFKKPHECGILDIFGKPEHFDVPKIVGGSTGLLV